MDKPPRIIAAVDLSDLSSAVLGRALRLASQWGCGVELLHVMEPLAGEEAGPLLPPLRRWVERARRETELRFQRLVSHAHPAEGLELTTRMVEGRGFVEIIKAAREHVSPLIVMGAPHPHLAPASTLGRVIRKGDAPVLVVRRVPGESYRNVCVGVDFSNPSRLAADVSTRLAGPDARFTLIHVLASGGYDHLLEQRDEALQDRAERLDVWAQAHLPGADTKVVLGQPKLKLLEQTDVHGADLLALGSHGVADLAHLLLGSVAESAAQRASCDVLVCCAIRKDFQFP